MIAAAVAVFAGLHAERLAGVGARGAPVAGVVNGVGNAGPGLGEAAAELLGALVGLILRRADAEDALEESLHREGRELGDAGDLGEADGTAGVRVDMGAEGLDELGVGVDSGGVTALAGAVASAECVDDIREELDVGADGASAGA